MRIKDWYCPTCKKFRNSYVQAIEKPSTSTLPPPRWRLCCKKCTTPLVNIREEVEKITKKADEEHAKKILAKYESKSSEEKIPTFKTVPSSPMSYCEPTLSPISESTSFFSEEELLKIRDILDEYINDVSNNDVNNKEATANASLPKDSVTTEYEKPLTMAERDALEINGENIIKINTVRLNTSDYNALISDPCFCGFFNSVKETNDLPVGAVYAITKFNNNVLESIFYQKTSDINSNLLGKHEERII